MSWAFGGVINVESVIWSAITLSLITGMLSKALPRVPGAVVGTAWGATALAVTGALLVRDTADTNLEIVGLGLLATFPAFLTGFTLISLVGDWKREERRLTPLLLHSTSLPTWLISSWRMSSATSGSTAGMLSFTTPVEGDQTRLTCSFSSCSG